MPQKILRSLYLGLSSLCLMLLMGSCGSGPQITVFISDPAKNGMEFYNEKTNQQGFVNYGDTDKFVCFNPTDTQTLLTYCGVIKK